MNELQPWTHEISGLVDKLVEQHSTASCENCEACAHQVGVAQ